MIDFYKIIIKGSFGEGNFGDDALMLVLSRIIGNICSEDNYAFICNADAGYINNIIPSVAIIRKGCIESYSSNLLLYGGGTQFFSFNNGGKTIEDNINKILKLFNDGIIKNIALRIRKKSCGREGIKYRYMASLGIGIGPFSEKKDAIRIAKLFSLMSYVAVRDKNSYEFCQSHEISKAGLYSDLCFLPNIFDDSLRSDFTELQKVKKRIGVIVRDWSHDDKGIAYSESIKNVINTLRDFECEVTYILFAGKNDVQWLKDIVRNNETYILWDPNTDTVEGFIKKLSIFDLFITARYHGAVFGALLGKPSVCIGIEPKLIQISEIMGDGGRLWNYPFIEEECVSAVMSVIKEYKKAISAISEFVKMQGDLADDMIKSFVDFADYIKI